MAIVTYVTPFEHIYGTTYSAGGVGALTSTHHGETGDIVRRRGRGERLGPRDYSDSHIITRWPPGEAAIAWKHSEAQWALMNAFQLGQWGLLLAACQKKQDQDVPWYPGQWQLFLTVNTYRWFATRTTTTIAPDINKLPGPYATIQTLGSDGVTFSGSANTPNAPDDALLFIRATNSRKGQARLFTLNDLHTPIYPFHGAFIPIAAGAANWSFVPNVVSIQPGDAMGIQTRLMSSEYLPLNPHFERIAIVSSS